MTRAAAALLLVFWPLASRAMPIDTVLAALDAEQAVAIERVRLFVQRGDVADVYFIDRARPGRFRMIKNPRQGGMQVVIIDGTEWLRTDTVWQRSPAPATQNFLPSMAGLFRAGLTGAVEQPGPDGGRSIEGDMTWTNGAPCQGRLLMRIDAAGLPSLMRFEGTCGGQPTRFRQAFSYVGPLTIEPPQ